MKRWVILASVAVVALGAAALSWPARPVGVAPPETVRIASGPQGYRPAGEFRQGTRVVDAPKLRLHMRALTIMKHHVQRGGVCAVRGRRGLCARTGQRLRLPTDSEWLRAAAERGSEDGFDVEATSADPSRRWIASSPARGGVA